MSDDTYANIVAANGRQRRGVWAKGAEAPQDPGIARAVRPARNGGRLGPSEPHWRLGQKILDAFTYAYSVGDREAASDLRAILTRLEHRAQAKAPLRHVPLSELADRWTAFVAARNAYIALLERRRASEVERAAAFRRMKARYLRWSEG